MRRASGIVLEQTRFDFGARSRDLSPAILDAVRTELYGSTASRDGRADELAGELNR
jgi:hypothetical protein